VNVDISKETVKNDDTHIKTNRSSEDNPETIRNDVITREDGIETRTQTDIIRDESTRDVVTKMMEKSDLVLKPKTRYVDKDQDLFHDLCTYESIKMSYVHRLPIFVLENCVLTNDVSLYKSGEQVDMIFVHVTTSVVEITKSYTDETTSTARLNSITSKRHANGHH
jgi:hypothetical protein